MAARFGNREPVLCALPVTGEGRGPCRAVRRQGTGSDLVIAERFHPPAPRRRPPLSAVAGPEAGEGPPGPGCARRGERVLARLLGKPRLLVPRARPLVQDGHEGWLGPGEPAAEQLREQVMVAVPLAGGVGRDEGEGVPAPHLADPPRGPGDGG